MNTDDIILEIDAAIDNQQLEQCEYKIISICIDMPDPLLEQLDNYKRVYMLMPDKYKIIKYVLRNRVKDICRLYLSPYHADYIVSAIVNNRQIILRGDTPIAPITQKEEISQQPLKVECAINWSISGISHPSSINSSHDNNDRAYNVTKSDE